jgi:hypothetical protein
MEQRKNLNNTLTCSVVNNFLDYYHVKRALNFDKPWDYCVGRMCECLYGTGVLNESEATSPMLSPEELKSTVLWPVMDALIDDIEASGMLEFDSARQYVVAELCGALERSRILDVEPMLSFNSEIPRARSNSSRGTVRSRTSTPPRPDGIVALLFLDDMPPPMRLRPHKAYKVHACVPVDEADSDMYDFELRNDDEEEVVLTLPLDYYAAAFLTADDLAQVRS